MANHEDATCRALYKVPGQHIYGGINFNGRISPGALEKVRHLEFHEDDVLLVSYPQAGLPLVQEVTWLVTHNVDTDTALKVPLADRSWFLEYCPPDDGGDTGAPPRVMKTHLPIHYFEQKIRDQGFKVIVLIKDLKATLTDFYHFYKVSPAYGCFDGTWTEFFELFKKKALCFGDWADMNKGWLELRNNPNVMFLNYRDLEDSFEKQIRLIANHLNVILSAEQIKKVLALKRNKNSPCDATYYTEEQMDYINRYLASNSNIASSH